MARPGTIAHYDIRLHVIARYRDLVPRRRASEAQRRDDLCLAEDRMCGARYADGGACGASQQILVRRMMMPKTAVMVVIEVLSVSDPMGMKQYQERASKLIGPLGGVMLGVGGKPVEGEAGFGPLAIQRWPSEDAWRAWVESEEYKPLLKIREASATLRVALVPVLAGHDV